jgi:hypothetical protein
MTSCRAALAASLLVLLAAGPPAVAKPAGSAVIDGRQWALSASGEDLPWRQADAYCRDLRLDGHGDWRLPTLAELDTLKDPDAADGAGIRAPIAIDTCCIWSSTSLADRPAPGDSPTGAAPANYYWGIVFDGGIAYYSNQVFADGQALCTRDTD